MAEKSTGQWVGAVVGAVIGFFIGDYSGQTAMYGAALGGAIGGVIDPPKGPHINGPRLTDLSGQTAAYGTVIPRIYGTVGLYGNVFWLENNAIKEVAKEEGGGKGGGGGATSTTYSYYATFAVGLCRGPIAGIRRLWIGNNLVYDASSADLATIIASSHAGQYWTLYTGTETQDPDPRMQAALGVANTPAYRGLAYIVFNDLPLADYGNSLMGAQIKAEVVTLGSETGYERIVTVADTGVRFREDGVTYNGVPYLVSVSDGVFRVTTTGSLRHYLFSADGALLGQEIADEVALPANASPIFYCGYFNSDNFLRQQLAVDTSKVISDGAFYLATSGIPIIDVLPLDRTVIGVVIANDEKSVFVLLAKPGESPYSSLQREWFVLDSGLHAIASGVTSMVLDIYNFGFSRSAEYHFAASSFDSNTKQIASIYGTGSGDINIYDYSDGELVRVFQSSLGSGLSSYTFTKPTGYLKDGVLYAFSGQSYNVFAAHRLTDTSQPLSDIVQAECLSSALLESTDLNTTGLTQIIRGYRIGSVGAIRSALEPLQATWLFDVIQDGYKIAFIPRGRTSMLTISQDELGARAGGDKPVQRLSISREMDSQLPATVGVRYLDPNREYDQNEQGAERLNTDAINERTVEIAVVMLADEAAAVAEKLLYLYWLERHDLSFTLPPNRGALQPGDVITLTTDSGNHEVRLTGLQHQSDNTIEISAKYNNSSINTSYAVGDVGQINPTTINLTGPSLPVLLDIPCLVDSMDTPGFLAAACGYYAGWPGGVLARSDDGGQSWQQVQGITPPVASIGYLVSAPASPANTVMIDKATAFSVRLISGSLASVTEAQMLNGANHFAIGAHGRWEIIAAKNSVLQGDGSYLLSDLLRGRFGTEWATGGHQVNDKIILLNNVGQQFVEMPVSSIGSSRLWRMPTIGKTLDSAREMAFTYQGNNLECLSPVYLNGNRHPTTNDWTLTWVRRTRVGAEWRDKVDAALGETSEAYEVEIYTSNTYATLKRTITGLSSATASYTSAQQVTDFGSNQATLYVKVYQLSANVGRGMPLTTSITR